jgi:hypothetical protein
LRVERQRYTFGLYHSRSVYSEEHTPNGIRAVRPQRSLPMGKVAPDFVCDKLSDTVETFTPALRLKFAVLLNHSPSNPAQSYEGYAYRCCEQ